MDPSLYKDAEVSRGFTYHYFYRPAANGKPTLLLLHGFPSSSYGWHRQVEYFRPKGYGLLKPEDPEAFRLALMARDIVDLLDVENVDKAIGVAHDWGSALLSRLANLFEDRFHAFAWLVAPYRPPSLQPMDIDAVIAELLKKTGDPGYGYWKWFIEDDAYLACEQNLDSFLQLVYPQNPRIWFVWLTPVGKTKQWVEENRRPGLPEWLTPEEYESFRNTLAQAGLKSSLNWYKAAVKSVNLQDEKKIPPEAWKIHKPVLFLAAKRNATGGPAVGRASLAPYCPDAEVIELDCGHWPQLEATEDVNQALQVWIERLV
ncbi:Alpha/Beta hydrolase protein [Trametes punicea]|nr:Alpha/Beta hydrolase protein [Trametes punicea]